MIKQQLNRKSENQRTRAYKKNTLLLMIFQFLSIAISFLLVPVVINTLGKEEYGIWIVLTTIVGWLGFFDLGLGNGLRNKYAEAKARGSIEDVKRYVSTGFFVICGISLALFLLFMLAYPFVSWTAVFAADASLAPQLNTLIIIVVASFCLRFACNIIGTLLTADQKPAITNLINLLGQALSLIVVIVMVKFSNPNLLQLGAALSISQMLPVVIAAIFLFSTRYKTIAPKKKYFSRSYVSDIFSLGIKFFAIQITALVIFQTNNFVIAHVCSLNDVTDFNIAYKYMSILQIGFTTLLTPLWSASTDAYTRGDIQWIKNAVRKINYLWVASIAVGLLMVVVSPFAYKIWLKGSVVADYLLLSLCLVYFLALTFDNIYRNFMNGTGKIRLQFILTLSQAILHIPLIIIAGKQFGLYGILLVMILWQVISCFFERHQYNLLISNKATGIWNK